MTLEDVGHRLLAEAREADNGRAAEIVVHDGPLRQTLLALATGTELAEHNSPPAASMYVMVGAIKITGAEPDLLRAGDMKPLTHVRHGVSALEDSVFLLTTVTGIPGKESHDEREKV